MENEKKCDKYEALFVFNNDEALNEHIKNCPDCKREHEKYQKISSLVKEVAPEYLKRHEQNKHKSAALKKVACFLIVLAGLSGYTGYNIYDYNSFQVSSADESYIYNMGLPTDEYGFLAL